MSGRQSAEKAAPRYRIKVHRQGASIYVIGTDDVHVACRAAGISSATHSWSSTDYGLYVRRQRRWTAASDYMPPKDAKPGVCFVGRIVERATPPDSQPTDGAPC